MPARQSPSPQEQASHDALRVEYDRLEAEYAQAEELPDEVDQHLGEIETTLETFDARPVIYDPAEIARAGVFISASSPMADCASSAAMSDPKTRLGLATACAGVAIVWLVRR